MHFKANQGSFAIIKIIIIRGLHMNRHSEINPSIPYLKGNFFLGRLANFLELDGLGIIRLLDEAKAVMHDKNK